MNNETPESAARRLAASQIAKGYEFKALHTYVTKDGAPIYWRIRLKHPNGDKWVRPMYRNGAGYILGEPKPALTGKPLYALDRISANPDEAVWITEGEQKADALNNLGFVATTSGSSTSADGADWGPLQGRICILWPDNDDPGQKYADEVTRKLSDLDCAVEHIDVAALGLGAKHDAVDWLALNSKATRDDIDALPRCAATPRDTATKAPNTQAPVFTASKTTVDLINGSTVTPERIDWVWEGWLAGGKLHILGGSAGTGKTTLALAMAAIITTGGLWPDGTRS